MKDYILFIVVLIAQTFYHNASGENSEQHSEELFLKPLQNNYVYSHFRFTTSWNHTELSSFKHCHLFPLTISEIVKRYCVQELHITLTQGAWNYKVWGYPIIHAAPGAEVWVKFTEDVVDVNAMWTGLVNALSGLLCASLNFIDEKNSINPRTLFYKEHEYRKSNNASTHIRYAALPHEVVCTENLTPWKKLLPCKSSGLVSLLNPRFLHSGFHSLSLHFKSNCVTSDYQFSKVKLTQTLSLVHDLMLYQGNAKTWSLRKLFGYVVRGGCPLASLSHIYLDITGLSDSLISVSPVPRHIVSFSNGEVTTPYAVYQIGNLETPFDFEVTQQFNLTLSLPQLLANRYLLGYGQERGRIVTEIQNENDKPIDAVYLENIPWYLPLFYHTLKIQCNGEIIKPLRVHYFPGMSRVRPYHLEMAIRLKPRSVTVISFEVRYMFLKWQEYPPDANKGFYIGSAIISSKVLTGGEFRALPFNDFDDTNDTVKDGHYLVQLRTEILLANFPTPDFSMPYNVICLVCTVIALAFGPLHNMTTKRLGFEDEKDTSVAKQYLLKIKAAFKKRFAWRRTTSVS